MFSFYRIVEALDKIKEQMDVAGSGISNSGVTAAGAINPPESPSKSKKLEPPIRPEEDKIPNTDIPMSGEGPKPAVASSSFKTKKL